MTNDSHSVLPFYALLRRHDLGDPAVQRALAFTRVAHDLLLRIAAAWAVQRGEDLTPEGAILPHEDLFCGFLEERALIWDGDNSGPSRLLSDAALWLAQDFDASDPFSSSYQVWVGGAGTQAIQLAGPARTVAAPPGLTLDGAGLIDPSAELQQAPVAAIGHYDVHGLAMLSLCLHSLRDAGVSEARGILSFETTGDIGKLWKRTVPQAIKASGEGGTVMLIDCPIHSRTPEHTLKALRTLDAVPGARLFLIDHHYDTIALAPRMARPGLQLVLTDVLSCSLLGADNQTTRELRVLGALGDKVPEVAAAYPPERHGSLWSANSTYNDLLIHFSPTPKELKSNGKQPCEPLWEALAATSPVSPDLVHKSLGISLGQAGMALTPSTLVCGALLFVTDRLNVLGRSWYALLESLMEAQGCSYAVATRLLDGNRANMLLLTHWRHTSVPPIRNFVPEAYWPRCLGHPAAVWVDLDKRDAPDFLRAVAVTANHFFESSGDFAPVAAALRQNILEQAPSVYGSSTDSDTDAA